MTNKYISLIEFTGLVEKCLKKATFYNKANQFKTFRIGNYSCPLKNCLWEFTLNTSKVSKDELYDNIVFRLSQHLKKVHKLEIIDTEKVRDSLDLL